MLKSLSRLKFINRAREKFLKAPFRIKIAGPFIILILLLFLFITPLAASWVAGRIEESARFHLKDNLKAATNLLAHKEGELLIYGIARKLS